MARKVPEINAGSMADIAFLLLIFFLVTTTMDTDKGLQRKLPPMPENDITPPDAPPVHKRDVFVVLINSQDQLLVQNEPLDITQLKEKAKEFIANPANRDNLPEKANKFVEGLGREMFLCKKAIISLQNDMGTSYNAYISVQNELARAYDELRDEFSKAEWGKPFAELEEAKQNIVRGDIYPQIISEAEPKNIGGGN